MKQHSALSKRSRDGVSSFGFYSAQQCVEIEDVDGQRRSVQFIDLPAKKGVLEVAYPPLVILGGTAQTINTFSPHFRALTETRRVIIPELRCQGATTLLSDHGNMKQHAKDFVKIMEALGVVNAIDLCGFSFGGRVALCVAAHYPHLVNKLSLTGVPLVRSALGGLILESWKEGLVLGQMRSTAWSFVLNGYSPSFLEKYSSKLSTFVDMVVQANDPKRLADLMVYSHISDQLDPFSVQQCASKVSCPTQIIAGIEDRIANLESVRALSQAIPRSSFSEMPSGHLAPFESPNVWRQHVLGFMNS